MNPHNISQVEFCRHYGVTARPHYGDFCDYVARKIKEVVDPETQIFDLRIESSWKDIGSNHHAAVRADGTRRDEKGALGADIVWLVRSRTFRGAFWSRILKRTVPITTPEPEKHSIGETIRSSSD